MYFKNVPISYECDLRCTELHDFERKSPAEAHNSYNINH